MRAPAAPLLLLLGLTLAACAGDQLGPDQDGDRLTDRQEEWFCTDPTDPDTDGDGVPDDVDPRPYPGPPTLRLEAGEPRQVAERWTIPLRARIRDARGQGLSGLAPRWETSLGQVAAPQEGEAGQWTAELSSPSGVARVLVCMEPPVLSERCRALTGQPVEICAPEQVINLCPALPQPGLNPAPAGRGPLRERLEVIAVDGATVGTSRSPVPFPDAYVQVDGADGTQLAAGRTDGCGAFLVADPALRNQAVTVTVAAQGRRYVTYQEVRAALVVVGLHEPDPLPGDPRRGAIRGRVTGFNGEFGIPPFEPTENILQELNIAMVLAAFRNQQLASLSMSNVLELPDPETSISGGISIPMNMVIHVTGGGLDHFTLPELPPGETLLFALAGRGEGVLTTLQDPYSLKFTPLALGLTIVTVEPGQTLEEVEIPLAIDLRRTEGAVPPYTELLEVPFGNLPPDPQALDPVSGQPTPFPMGLLLPIFDTGGYGFFFAALDSSYNKPDFRSPLELVVPTADHPALPAGLQLKPRVVGIAGRQTIAGADPPGIVTSIVDPVDGRADQADPGAWLNLLVPQLPTPPADRQDLDAVGGELTDEIAWLPPPDLPATLASRLVYIVRLGYLTHPPPSPIPGYTIGAPRSHPLWDIYLPGTRTSFRLPRIPEAELGWPPRLQNPRPSDEDPAATYRFDARTLELEFNACVLGAGGKPHAYNEDFLVSDINLHASHLSQDSYPVRVP